MMRQLFFLVGFLVPFFIAAQEIQKHFTYSHGGIIRADSTKKKIALVFTADEYGEGLSTIIETLKKENVKGSFFFTGRFYRNNRFQKAIKQLKRDAHYLGPHSDQHLLYCDWKKRDSLLVTRDSFEKDLSQNMAAMIALGLPVQTPHYFIPPYEWWNDSISNWCNTSGLTIVSFTPGVRTNADYTFPEMGTSYKSADWIMSSLKEFIEKSPDKLNGAVVLIHAGTDPRRKDKLYNRLAEIIQLIKKGGYQPVRIDSLLNH